MAAAETRFHTPHGIFELGRYPSRRDEPLRAWCAADSLLLEEIHRLGVAGSQILVVNDEQGALSVPLQAFALWTDSALAARAVLDNCQRNKQAPVPIVWSTKVPPSTFSHIVLRTPKQLAYLEYQLAVLAPLMPPGATLLAGGMDKHLSPRTAQLLERYIGPTERHRGSRKARLFSATRDDRDMPQPGDHKYSHYYCDEIQAQLTALPNVFSRDSLDIGSRFLLQHMHALPPVQGPVLDLACGNGVLGLAARTRGIARELVFSDESAMAIASARLNSASLFPDSPVDFHFHHGDGLLDYNGPDVELILCNPPFHLNHTVDEFAGRHLLAQCAAHLLPGGKLCLVANRHLDYLPTLKRGFRQVKQIAENARFKVWLAHKS